MLNNNIEDLSPEVKEMFLELQKRCSKQGIAIAASETLRTEATQAVYYLRGRIANDPLARKALSILGKAHAWEFNGDETQQIVTWTLDSNHFDGNAVDIVVYKKRTKTANWDKSSSDWQKVLQTARDIGFTCGADWKQNDFPHLEYRR